MLRRLHLSVLPAMLVRPIARACEQRVVQVGIAGRQHQFHHVAKRPFGFRNRFVVSSNAANGHHPSVRAIFVQMPTPLPALALFDSAVCIRLFV